MNFQRKPNALAAFVTVVSVGVLGCDDISSGSPGAVVLEIYIAANEGRYSDVEQLLTEPALEVYRSTLWAMAGGTKGIWDSETHNGTLANVEVLGEDIRGEGATVSVRLTFNDGEIIEVDRPLLLEGGSWRLSTW